MSFSENARKRELECLRLASDLTQLAALRPDLKAHCIRMAGIWTDQAERGLIGNVPLQSASYH